MRLNTLTASAVLLALACTSALADKGSSCHFHGSKPATETVVIACADARREALTKSGKLHASWGAAKHEKLEKIDGKKGKEWKITYKNPAAPQADKQVLYMFFTPPGNFIAANHTGQ